MDLDSDKIAPLARRIESLERVIADIGVCSSKREVNAILARYYRAERERKSAIAKAGQDLRHQKKLEQEKEIDPEV